LIHGSTLEYHYFKLVKQYEILLTHDKVSGSTTLS
jgi:hypothetical protein